MKYIIIYVLCSSDEVVTSFVDNADTFVIAVSSNVCVLGDILVDCISSVVVPTCLAKRKQEKYECIYACS